MKFFTWLFSTIWVGFQVMTGQKKLVSLKAEDPPVPLVVFRQSSRMLVFWPVVVITWLMALYAPYTEDNVIKIAVGMELEEVEQKIDRVFGKENAIKVSTVHEMSREGGGYIYGPGHPKAADPVPFFKNAYRLGGWWAVVVCIAVLILRVKMKLPLTLAISAIFLVFYFYLDKIGQLPFFLSFLRNIKIHGNGYMYGFLALIPTVDILVVWLYARFHYFIATPNKGFLIWGMYASERPIEYAEYEINIDVDDVVERTFGFGGFELRHRSNPSLSCKFPCVWRIAHKMSKFNEVTTEFRVRAVRGVEE